MGRAVTPEPAAESAATPSEAPFVTITPDAQGKLQLLTNINPELAPMVLWFLERGKHQWLTDLWAKEQAQVVRPSNGMTGLLRRMGKG